MRRARFTREELRASIILTDFFWPGQTLAVRAYSLMIPRMPNSIIMIVKTYVLAAQYRVEATMSPLFQVSGYSETESGRHLITTGREAKK